MAQTIAAKAGREFLLKVSDGIDPPSFVTVGGLRNTRVTVNGNPVDVTNVASNGVREYLSSAGTTEMTVSADGVQDDPAGTAFGKLINAVMNKESVECQIISGHGDSFEGLFVVTSLERSGAEGDAELFTINLTADGPFTYTPAP